MTEHLDFQHGQIYFHGAPLGSQNDYMHSATILKRIRHLMECLPYLRCFFVLGDFARIAKHIGYVAWSRCAHDPVSCPWGWSMRSGW